MAALSKAVPFGALAAGAGYLYWLTLSFEFPRVEGRLGPDAWPKMILTLLIATCFIGIANAFLRSEAPRKPGGGPAGEPAPPRGVVLPSETEPEEAEAPSRYSLVIMGFALFLLYPVALEYAGFLVATFLLMAIFMRVGQWRNIAGVLAASLIGTLVLFYVFRGVVYVSLPLGTGPFLELSVWVASLLGMR